MTDIPSVEQAFARLDMPLQEAMMTQRAVRRVLPDPVDDAIVRKCIELALRAPTGSNGQNWEFVVVKDRAVKEKLARRYRQAWTLALATQYRPWTQRTGLRRKLVSSDDPMAKLLRAVQWQVDNFAEIPVHVVPCLGGGVRSGIVPYAPAPHVLATGVYGSIYPSVQNLLLAARAMGLGANLITLPLWSTTSAQRILGLPMSVRPYCIIPLGWPRGRYGPTTRKPVEDVVHLDTYGNRAWLDRQDSHAYGHVS